MFEGIDGSGKSTQAKRLARAFGALLTAEPGATELGAALRALLLDPDSGSVSLRTEALLMAADRAEHVAKVLQPALEGGTWVVCDRFTASTIAYQGYGRALDLAELQAVVTFAAQGVEPDVQVLLDVPVELAQERRRRARADRLEHLGNEFFERARRGYLSMARADSERWIVIDGSAEVGEVQTRIFQAVSNRLGRPSKEADA